MDAEILFPVIRLYTTCAAKEKFSLFVWNSISRRQVPPGPRTEGWSNVILGNSSLELRWGYNARGDESDGLCKEGQGRWPSDDMQSPIGAATSVLVTSQRAS